MLQIKIISEGILTLQCWLERKQREAFQPRSSIEKIVMLTLHSWG